MVRVTVDNYKDKESLAVYELPEGSLIIDLKAEIEATEGIPIGHQRLGNKSWDGPDYQDYQDNQNLDSLVSGDPHETIVYLNLPVLYYRFQFQETTEFGRTSDRALKHKHQEPMIMKMSMDLNKPICTSDLMEDWRYRTASPPQLFVLDPDGQPTISILDISKPFSYYGIRNGDVINVISLPPDHDVLPVFDDNLFESDNELHRPSSHCTLDSHQTLSGLQGYFHRRSRIVKAKHNWDGEIMHPHFKGLPLKRNLLISVETNRLLGWLYGSSIPSANAESPEQSHVPALNKRMSGYFPENYVSLVEEAPEQPSETTDAPEIPPLPPFQFPPANRMTFRLPISDKGHSFLKLTVNYECISPPADPTHVTISLLCTTHDIRRVSAITVFITIPQSEILNVEVGENEAHRKEIHTDKEVTENQSKERHLDGVNIGTHVTTVGIQGGISGKYSFGSTEKGSKVSRRKVTAGIDKENSIFWNLKAPSTKLDEDGLNGDEFITLVLKQKPVEFRYNCRVTHAKNGVEKTTERRTKYWIWKF